MHIEMVKIPGTMRGDQVCWKKSLTSFGKPLLQFQTAKLTIPFV